MKEAKIAFIFLVFVSLACSVRAAEYYVAPDGNALWSQCTEISHPCNATTAMENAEAGDTVYFLGGIYEVQGPHPSYHAVLEPSHSGKEEAPITFKSYPGESVIINCNIPESYDGCFAIGSSGKEFITFEGFTVTSNHGTKIGGIFIGGNTGEPTYRGLKVINCTLNGGTGTIVRNTNREALRIEDTIGAVIRDNYIYNVRQDNLQADNIACLKSYHNNRLLIENNEFFNCSSAISFKGITPNAIIRNNYIHNVIQAIRMNSYSWTGFSCDQRNITIYNNVIAYTKHCTICDVVEDTADSDNMNIYNNIFYTGNSKSVSAGLGGGRKYFYNNILYGIGRDTDLGILKFKSGRNDDGSNDFLRLMECDHNLYTDIPGEFLIRTVKPNPSNQEELVYSSYRSLEEWKNSHELYGGGNPGEGSLVSDPKFLNASGAMKQLDDFRLSQNSPCRGAGRNGKDIGANIDCVGRGRICREESHICEAKPGHNCWYVAPWGNDSGDGSFEKPFKTIQKGVDSMQPGDYLYLRNGTYHEIGIYLGSNFWHGSEDAWYTIKSYPGEWAIVDGQHNISNNAVQEEVNSWSEELNVFRATTQSGRIGYVKFESMEITGGGLDINDPQYPVSGAAINIRGGPFVFRRLYIHDNYGKDNNNAAGLRLGNGVCNSIIEYCHFRSNSQIREDPEEPGVRTTSIANVLIFADYAYSNPVTLYREDTGYCSATFGNEIRYNLFEADSNRGSEYFTNVGFKQKGMQRLTGYIYADQKNPEDELPNDDSLKSLGDKIHHNIFINHTVGIEIDQDYAQVYNNIIIMKKREGPNNAIQGRDENSERRGPFSLVVYNNLIKGNGMSGIRYHPVPDGWLGDVPYIKAYIYNNILDNVSGDYDSEDISIESDGVSASGGYPMENISLDRNYFYNPPDPEIFYIYHTKYNKTEIEATPSADTVFVGQKNPENPLYSVAHGYEIKIREKHNLGNGINISHAGIGIPHPYLEGISIPSYIGPCPDSECSWVDDVLALSDITALIEGRQESEKFSPADTNHNGRIEISELIFFLRQWKNGSVNMADIIEAIIAWKHP